MVPAVEEQGFGPVFCSSNHLSSYNRTSVTILFSNEALKVDERAEIQVFPVHGSLARSTALNIRGTSNLLSNTPFDYAHVPPGR